MTFRRMHMRASIALVLCLMLVGQSVITFAANKPPTQYKPELIGSDPLPKRSVLKWVLVVIGSLALIGGIAVLIGGGGGGGGGNGDTGEVPIEVPPLPAGG